MIVDVFTRETVAIEAGQSLKGEDVVRTLNKLKNEGRVPKLVFCDNGSEFVKHFTVSRALTATKPVKY